MKLPTLTEEMIRNYERVRWIYRMGEAKIEAERYLDWNERYRAFREVREQIEYAEIVDIFERLEDTSIPEQETWEKACGRYFEAHKDIFAI